MTAPHGTFDRGTAALALAVARRLDAGYVIARGFDPGVRINVNRPTEGAGLSCDRETVTARAQQVYDEYRRLVELAAGAAPLRLYVEIHGNARAETVGQIEVATKGIALAEAERVKAAYPALLARARGETASYPALALLVEPADQLRWTASCDKRLGVMASGAIRRALHVELPRAARDDALSAVTAGVLAGLVAEIISETSASPSR
ncbi:MAG TPA: hypothetical protein VEL75_16885 [Candidatus Methylomirabilis sp.]|nr:hypothetical protein [Candidatus Methylomirabilis sp.]